jgi:hypothetical protein
MKQRAPFHSVTADVDDARLERLATDKGVGALVRPAPERAGEGAPPRITVPVANAKPPTKAEAVETAAVATPRSEMKSVNIELPVSVWTELKIRAARQQTSVRHIIMTLLRNDGIDINDADMVEDGRRLRR